MKEKTTQPSYCTTPFVTSELPCHAKLVLSSMIITHLCFDAFASVVGNTTPHHIKFIRKTGASRTSLECVKPTFKGTSACASILLQGTGLSCVNIYLKSD